MMRRCAGLLVALSLGCAESPGGPSEPSAARSQAATLSLQLVAQGLASPVLLTSPPNDPRLFVLEKVGRIRVIENGVLLPTPFLDIRGRVGSVGGEQGLLGLAFHPRYDQNHFFYVDYTDKSGNTQIERYRVYTDPNRADTLSARRILSIAQPFANHNGGMIAFGEDRMLYIAMGDGGSGGDPQGHGQNMNSLLGKMLRIDVDNGSPYAIPASNPFVGTPGVRPEIWASGLRNPWRFSFDRARNYLYIADVGQTLYEEINIVPSNARGLNYGWKLMEGMHCFVSGCSPAGLHVPQAEYTHADGCSITGGYVYRGRRMRAMIGHYFYADYCRAGVRTLLWSGGLVSQRQTWPLPLATQVTSFGEGADGELYVVSQGGRIYRIVAS